MKSALLLACAALLFLGVVSGPAQADMEFGEDDFGEPVIIEDFDTGHVVLSAPSSEEYTHSVPVGSFSSVVQTSVAQSSPNAWKTQRASGTNALDLIDFSASGALDICSGANIDFWLRVGTGANEVVGVGDTFSGSSTAAIKILIVPGTVMRGVIDGSSTEVTGDILTTSTAIDTWYHIRVSDIDCAQASATFSELTTSSSISVDAGGNLNAFDTDNSHDMFGHFSNTVAPVYIDNLKLPSQNVDPGSGSSFCPIPSHTDFGMNYVEQVSFVDAINNVNGISLNDYYEFDGEADDSVYMAKGWPATETYHDSIHLTLEAATEGEDSIFEVRWSFVDPTPYLSGETYTTAAKGNGESTASFAEFEGLYFEETSNNWIVSHRYSNGGSVAQSGASWSGGSPNSDSSFIIELDSNLEGHFLALKTSTGVDLLNHSLAGGHNGDRIYQVWLIGFSGDANFQAFTGVNDDDTSFQSSCIFFHDVSQENLEVLGDQGSTADDPSLGEEPATVGDGLPGVDTQAFAEGLGIAEEAAGWIVALLLFVGLVGGLITFGPIVAGIGGVLAIGMSVAFNLIPVWFLLFLALMAAVVIVLVVTRRG